jgi:TPR repeat protein
MMAFAPMLAGGDGVPANFNKARELLETAIAAGYAKDAAKILGDLYMAQPRNNKTLAKAKETYALAAQAGNPEANLRLAIILSGQFKDTAARAGAIEQFRVAASALGAEEVAKEMMRLNARTLIALTQEFLAEYGYDGPVDGVSGPAMKASIKIYCDARKVEKCETNFVRQSLLAQLLTDSRTPKPRTVEQ